jgi:prepilin-type N-terminal cleavage/methylation domain-containing protein
MRLAPSAKLTNCAAQKGRKAFTLLEVLLSAAIGVLLMAALYVAMNVQLDHAQAGRDAVEQSLLVRALFRRISNDVTPSLAAAAPANFSSGGMASGGGAAGGGSSTPPASGATTPTAAGSGAGAASSSTPNSGSLTSSTAPVLNLQGDSERLILWVSRISSDLSPLLTNQPVASDLRRVVYWMASTGGLARQEIKLATSDDALVTVPPNIPDEANSVIAEEVQSVTFRYFDGTAWQDSWDGTQASSTSASPMGPPLAVEITLVIATPNSQSQIGDTANVKTYRHVVAIPTANGASSAPSSTTQQ